MRRLFTRAGRAPLHPVSNASRAQQLTRFYSTAEAASERGPFKRLVFLSSLALFAKVSYDLTKGYMNYSKLTALDRLQSVWNEAVVSVFFDVAKDPEVAKELGTPVVMGAPPAQSVSPLTINSNGLEFDVVVGPYSIFSDKKSYSASSGGAAEPTIFDEEIVSQKTTTVFQTLRDSWEDISEKLPVVKLPAMVGYIEITVPIVGKNGRGKVHVLAYTNDEHEWTVKYAKVTKEDGTLVKEIVANHYVPGIPASI